MARSHLRSGFKQTALRNRDWGLAGLGQTVAPIPVGTTCPSGFRYAPGSTPAYMCVQGMGPCVPPTPGSASCVKICPPGFAAAIWATGSPVDLSGAKNTWDCVSDSSLPPATSANPPGYTQDMPVQQPMAPTVSALPPALTQITGALPLGAIWLVPVIAFGALLLLVHSS
jgi:hypothetical protein